MKKWIPILILILLLAGVALGFAEEKNYCHDPAAEAEWAALLSKHPKDYKLQALHALRIGICVKVDQGVLTLEKGTDIFEKARAALVEQWKAENQKKDLKEKKAL